MYCRFFSLLISDRDLQELNEILILRLSRLDPVPEQNALQWISPDLFRSLVRIHFHFSIPLFDLRIKTVSVKFEPSDFLTAYCVYED